MGVTAKPFIKWAGGKTQLLSQLAAHFPQELLDGAIDRYVEPFLGGGAVFLHVAQTFPISEAVLFDINAELILVYKVVQREPQGLIELLGQYNDHHYSLSDAGREAYFYKMREMYNRQRSAIDYKRFSQTWIERAAYMIYLNKTCYNGLYRVNASGGFNVPFGRYKRPSILDEKNLLKVSELLQKATLYVGSFEECEPFVDDRTFVYFDPPYRPLSVTSNFTSYSKTKFNDVDQIRLSWFFAQLDRSMSAKLMLSNSDPKNSDPNDNFFDTLYADFNIHRVYANRMINSKGNGRGKITELLITNTPQHYV